MKARLRAGDAARHGAAGHSRAEADPHAWQNPRHVGQHVHNIADALARPDPAGAAPYQANANAFATELQALDAWAEARFAAIPASQRQAFGYPGGRYGIAFLAPPAEPSARQVGLLIRQIRREKIKAVFVENMSSPRLLARLSRDAGVKPGPALYVDALSAPGEAADTCLKLMRHNIAQLAAGMRAN